MNTSVADSVLPIVQRTRDMLMPFYGNIEVLEYKSESAHDAVTRLDRGVETFLAEELKKIDPTAGFAGEEFGGDRTADRFWLCDPIDGTAHYIRGLPYCTVMLALIEEGSVNFSVIYDFVNDTFYNATRGKGAFSNNTRISVSNRLENDMYFCWETHMEKPENMDIFLKLREKTILFKALCAGHEYMLVATGKLEGRVTFDPYGHDWDYAPGSLLVSEAGGVVANLGSSSYDHRNLDFIAASPNAFKMLTEEGSIFPISA